MTSRVDRPHARPLGLAFFAFALAAAGQAVVTQTPATPGQAPAGQAGQAPPGAPAQGAPNQGDAGGRGRGGGRQDLSGIDFTKQPPVLAKTPEEQLKLFILPPGYRLELVLSDPIIQEPTAIAFDGNGRMFVVEDRSYMLDLDMTGQLDPISRISLHVDTNNDGVYDKHTRVRRQHGVPAVRDAVRSQHDPDEGVQRAGGVEVHRHQRRRRRRQEGALRYRLRPAGEHRRPGGVPHLDARQLDVQHLQRLPRAMDTARHHQGADGRQRRRVGRHTGQRRQDVVRQRRARRAGRASSSRSCTATSPFPTSSSRTSGFPGARRSASPTCRAA